MSFFRSCRLLACGAAATLAGCAGWLGIDGEESGVSRSLLRLPPGAVSDEVTQASLQRTICSPGWLGAARAPAAFVESQKARLLKEQGVPPSDAGRYRLDHLIPVAIGGHARKRENLWLQPLASKWDVHAKDRLGVKLNAMVCRGEVPLKAAQDAVRTDWKLAVRYYLSDRDLLEDAH